MISEDVGVEPLTGVKTSLGALRPALPRDLDGHPGRPHRRATRVVQNRIVSAGT